MFAAFVTRFEQSFTSLPSKVRTFLAIRVGDEVEAAIYRLIEELRAPNDGVAWARRDQLHVTVKFLGAAVDSARLAPWPKPSRRSARLQARFKSAPAESEPFRTCAARACCGRGLSRSR